MWCNCKGNSLGCKVLIHKPITRKGVTTGVTDVNTFEPEFSDMQAQPNMWGQIMPSIMVLKTEEFKKKQLLLISYAGFRRSTTAMAW